MARRGRRIGTCGRIVCEKRINSCTPADHYIVDTKPLLPCSSHVYFDTTPFFGSCRGGCTPQFARRHGTAPRRLGLAVSAPRLIDD